MKCWFVFLFAAMLSLQGVEPWADQRLNLTSGLIGWFDVSRQTAGRGALGLTPLQSWSDAPDVLLDGSGHKRHLLQPLLASRPRFRQEFNGAMLSFDGTNDFLSAAPVRTAETNLTVFIVAMPRSNAGFFRGFFGFNAAGQNDYTTGLNLDFGGAASSSINTLNVEGGGCPGQANLLTTPQRFGRWHIFSVVAGRGEKGVKLFLDSQPQGSRDRAVGSLLHLDEVTLGARRYSNTPDRPHVQGFFHGEFGEMLVFNRALPDSDRAQVERYLSEKYGALLRGLGEAPVRDLGDQRQLLGPEIGPRRGHHGFLVPRQQGCGRFQNGKLSKMLLQSF